MELTLDQALRKGVEAYKAGKVQEADRYYTAILKANPKHPDANHNMGVLAVGLGKVEAALPFFKTALEVNQTIGQYWLSYINALIKLDRLEDAKSVLDQAKSKGVNGDGFDKLKQRLGGVEKDTGVDAASKKPKEPLQKQVQSLIDLHTQGQYQEALTQSLKLLEQFPSSINLYNIIGAAYKGLERLEEAIETYTKALSIEPHYAEAYYNMGIVLKEQSKLEEAIEAYNKTLLIKPHYAEAYNNMGIALKDQGKLEEAVEAYNKALAIKPDYAEAYYNMGIVLQKQGKLEEAVEAYNKAISIKPDYAGAYNNMGIAFKDQGKLDKAIEAYNKALSIKPDSETLVNASDLRNQLLGTALINEEFEKKLKTRSPELIEMPKFQIHQAIGAFLSSDQKLLRKHLNSYSSCPPSSITQLKEKDRVFCSAYNVFLQKLIGSPFKNKPTPADYQTIFHIGESHCLSYAHRFINIHGIDYNVAPRITFGGKAFHFSTEKESAFKAITKSNFDSLLDGSKVFISFGEIDCRPNEGFISAAKKYKEPIEYLVSDTIRGYVGWFAEQNQSKNHSIFFFNVPASIYNEKYSSEVNEEVTRTIKLFNSLLHKNVLDHDLNMIDVYKFTVGKDGFSHGLFHIDKYHLSSDAIPEIEKQLGAFL